MKVVCVLILSLVLTMPVWAEEEKKKDGKFPETLALTIEKTELERQLFRQRLDSMQLEFRVIQDELKAREQKLQALVTEAAEKAKANPQTSELDLPNRTFKPREAPQQ